MGLTKAERIARLREMIDAVPADVPFDDADADSGGGFAGDGREGPPSAERHAPGAHRLPSSRRETGPDDAGEARTRRRKRPKPAYERIVELCSHNDFCSAKMEARLAREGYGADAVQAALERAVAVGLIDDLRWGEMRAAGLMRKGMGTDGVERELREHGIEPTFICGWPDEFTERYGTDFDRALELLRKKPPRSKNPWASAYARLVRKGYGPSVASRAVKAWLDTGQS